MKNTLEEKTINNEEPLLVVDERSGFYIFGGLFLLVAFFLLFFILINTDLIILKLLSVIFLWIGFDILTNLLSFEKIIVYEDKMIIERNFLKDIKIKIDDIKNINLCGSNLIMSSVTFYTNKKNFFKLNKSLLVYALKNEDIFNIKILINKIKQGV